MSAPSMSSRTLRALAVFGLTVPGARAAFGRDALPAARSAAAAALLRLRAGPPCRILLAGHSGTGKSTALRLARRELRPPRFAIIHLRTEPLRVEPRPPIDLLRMALPAALSTLARAGLADPTLLTRPARLLSDGQRWRLAFALAARRASAVPAPRRPVLFADEFAACLDLPTACALALAATRSPVSILAASSRDELILAIRQLPDWLVIDLR